LQSESTGSLVHLGSFLSLYTVGIRALKANNAGLALLQFSCSIVYNGPVIMAISISAHNTEMT